VFAHNEVQEIWSAKFPERHQKVLEEVDGNSREMDLHGNSVSSMNQLSKKTSTKLKFTLQNLSYVKQHTNFHRLRLYIYAI